MGLWLPFRLRLFPLLIASTLVMQAATISGTVHDASGKPLQNVRIDHTGRRVIVVPPDVVPQPSPNEIRTDADGRFRVVTSVPAIVIRSPGYESQRIRITGDMELQVTLLRIRPASRCRLATAPKFHTKNVSDVDYTSKWFYIQTKTGPQGIVSGSGPTYSLGAPSDQNVWTSVEYTEVMYENGVVEASGHSADGKYWRSRSSFGQDTRYYNQTREVAEQLDCVMDRIPLTKP